MKWGSDCGHLCRSILVAFLAMILAISHVTQYSLCAYQWLFIDGSQMFVPFHPSITHALAFVAAILSIMHLCPDVSLSSVINCINIKHRQNWEWANQTVKVCAYREWAVELLSCCCCCLTAVSSRVGGSHLVNIGVLSVKLQYTELGLWPGVSVGGMRSHEHEW